MNAISASAVEEIRRRNVDFRERLRRLRRRIDPDRATIPDEGPSQRRLCDTLRRIRTKAEAT